MRQLQAFEERDSKRQVRMGDWVSWGHAVSVLYKCQRNHDVRGVPYHSVAITVGSSKSNFVVTVTVFYCKLALAQGNTCYRNVGLCFTADGHWDSDGVCRASKVGPHPRVIRGWRY